MVMSKILTQKLGESTNVHCQMVSQVEWAGFVYVNVTLTVDVLRLHKHYVLVGFSGGLASFIDCAL